MHKQQQRSLWLSLALLAGLAAPAAHADEGMWTFNSFPFAKVQQAYGFTPTQGWLDHLRLSAVRIANGCSASVVSADGLVMTNHHCARTCIENLSGLTKKDYNRFGFYAKGTADEARCPGMELNQLAQITDVTAQVQAATKNTPPAQFEATQKAAIAAIEKQCATSDDLRCEVVSLYRGGRYDLYTYRRLQDIRLVFAPEDRAAFFGGDPDNFNFPRYDLDVSFLRIYGKDGRPLATPEHLGWSDGRIQEGDPTFVIGNPGGTSRSLTVAQLQDDRDITLPGVLIRLGELRGMLTEYQRRGAEEKRHSNDMLFGIENGLKAIKGRHDALADRAFYGQLVQGEADFRARVKASPQLQAEYGDTWDQIATLVGKEQALRKRYNALERRPPSQLLRWARSLVRYGEEINKPNGERLKEYTDARLPQLREALLANEPVYDEMEVELLGWWLTKLREDLGPDDAVIRQVFGRRSPEEIAKAAVQGSHLKELRADAHGNATGGYRKQLLDGGPAAIAASHDPMIELARALDPAARAIRKRMEDEVDGPLKKQEERLAQARFAVYGQSIYPDATGTLRISYGAVKGYDEPDHHVTPFTRFAGAYERATGADPFALPPSWLKAKPALDLATPLNFVTDNDIIGGNSGSPMVDRDGKVVGLVFDGNIESLGGEYGFDDAVNRTVAVHSAALVEALDKVYGAQRIVHELQGQAPALASNPAPTTR
jgi:hypothetical protein